MAYRFGYLITIIILITCSCKKEQSNTLVVHVLNIAEDLHPCNGSSATRSELNLYTQSSLLRLDYKTGVLIPCLVKTLPIVTNNGLNYTYELKNGIFWDDNSPLTAQDVVYTSKANKCILTNNQTVKQFWDNVQTVKIDSVNPNKFTVVMAKPYILNVWFWCDVPILQQSFYDAKNTLNKYTISELTDTNFINTHSDIKQWADTFNSNKYNNNINFLIGAGPYKITNWDKGISITLEKKKNHYTHNLSNDWFNQSNPDKIIFKINTNNASTKLELKNKLIDASTMLDFNTFTELSNDEEFTKNYHTQLAKTYNYLYIAMNMKPDGEIHKKIFTDSLVRKAMAYLTPYNQINKISYNNKCTRVTGPVSPLKPDYNSDLKLIEFNIQKAKDLLLKAGWADTDNNQVLDKIIDGKKVDFEFNISFMATQKQWEDMAKQLAESMQKVNIYAKLNPMDYNSFVGDAMNHNFDMLLSAWQSSAQPDDFTQIWHTNSWKTNGLNFTGFGSAKTDSLIDAINQSVDEAMRIKLSKKLQYIIYNEQPYVFLFSQLRRVVVNKRWSNFEVYTEYPGVLLNTLKLK